MHWCEAQEWLCSAGEVGGATKNWVPSRKGGDVILKKQMPGGSI